MAARGRGRGRANLSFNVEELGFGRGEALPTAVLTPPPLFPVVSCKAAPLETGEKQEYMTALKQEFRNVAIESPFFVKADTRRRDVERYSDKYQQLANGDSDIVWNPDWSRFPAELHVKAKPSAPPKLPTKVSKDIIVKLSELEMKEKTNDGADDDEEEKEKEDDDDAEIEELFEEDDEEETDYAMTYFDNGDGYMDEEDDNLDDGPTY